MKYGIKLVYLLIVLINFNCTKNDISKPLQNYSKLNDSLYKYAQDVYLWNDKLPHYSVFLSQNTIKGNTEEDILRNEIFAISKYAINNSTDKSYEFFGKLPLEPKYSRIVAHQVSSQSERNFGISLVAYNDSLFVQYVIPGSPADNEALKRGDKILKINTQAVSFNLSFEAYLEQSLKDDRLELTVVRNGVEADILLFKEYYNASPINHLSLLNEQTGYISLLQFSNISAAQLQDKINFLGGISSLIIDLRYNNGGFVNLVEELANLLIPYSFNKQIMRKERYNTVMQSGLAFSLLSQPLVKDDGTPIYINGHAASLFDIDYSIDANTYFFNKKTGIPDLKKIVFIVSDKTASASELLISILKPYIKTKIIGVSSSGESNVRTFGKPVGFFKLMLGRFDLYLSMFQNFNKDDEGGYYDGIPADVTVIDNVRYDFGSIADESVKMALHFIEGVKIDSLKQNSRSSIGLKEMKSVAPGPELLIRSF